MWPVPSELLLLCSASPFSALSHSSLINHTSFLSQRPLSPALLFSLCPYYFLGEVLYFPSLLRNIATYNRDDFTRGFVKIFLAQSPKTKGGMWPVPTMDCFPFMKMGTVG
jgi:hypothetical protein